MQKHPQTSLEWGMMSAAFSAWPCVCLFVCEVYSERICGQKGQRRKIEQNTQLQWETNQPNTTQLRETNKHCRCLWSPPLIDVSVWFPSVVQNDSSFIHVYCLIVWNATICVSFLQLRESSCPGFFCMPFVGILCFIYCLTRPLGWNWWIVSGHRTHALKNA